LSGFDSWAQRVFAWPTAEKIPKAEKRYSFCPGLRRILSAFIRSTAWIEVNRFAWWVFLELLGNLPEKIRRPQVIENPYKERMADQLRIPGQVLRRLRPLFALEENENDDINSLKNALRM